MPLATRVIKHRIRSIQNTHKITKAMEMVAAAKMRKAAKAVLATRAYANSAWEIIKNLSAKTDPGLHPLLQKREQISKIGLILITSNRGLCGGFNRAIIEKTANYIKEQKEKNPSKKTTVIIAGKKGREIMHKYNEKIAAEFPKLDVSPGVSEISPLAQMVINDYRSGVYDKVVLAYTDYYSAMLQKPRIKNLLPLEGEDEDLGYLLSEDKPAEEKKEEYEYLFEPSPDLVLEQMLYRLIELQIYQAVLETNASEHSARMLAMRNASDAASDMIFDLNLSFNQARQQAITAELADISAGRAAIE